MFWMTRMDLLVVATTLTHFCLVNSCRRHRRNKILVCIDVCLPLGDYSYTHLRLPEVVPQLIDVLVNF